ncbi:MAG: DMT family transporter [Acidimicrobiia bacterium]|nr:DMT family transporter [Acidimicrobiia bacterium]
MTDTATAPARLRIDETRLALAGAGTAVCAWGASSVLAKAIDMGAMAIGTYRFGLYAVGILLWMRWRGPSPSWRMLRHSLWGGLALTADVALFFSAVRTTTVADASVVGSLQPLVIMAIGVPLFGERVSLRDGLLALVALAGVIGVVVASAGSPEWNVRGDLLAFGAVLGWSGYFVFSKRSAGVLTSTEFTAGTAIWVALANVPLAWLFGQSLAPPPARDWVLLGVMTIGSGVFGHSLMNWSLVRIPLWVGSTMTLLIPVASALLAWAALGEPLTAAQLAAMAVVIGALFAIVRNQTKRPPADASLDASGQGRRPAAS